MKEGSRRAEQKIRRKESNEVVKRAGDKSWERQNGVYYPRGQQESPLPSRGGKALVKT